jgi:hypothetical protein
MNRQLASEIAYWKVKFRKCSDDLLKEKSERSQDLLEMAVLRQEIDALRGQIQSPYVSVFATYKQQLVSEFEKQMSLISSCLVDLFHEKVDEAQSAIEQRAEELNKLRILEMSDLVTPEETPPKQEKDMDVEELVKCDTADIELVLEDSPTQLSTKSYEPHVSYHHATPIQSTPIQKPRRNWSHPKGHLMTNLQTPCLYEEKTKSLVSRSEKSANIDVGELIMTSVEESTELDGNQEEGQEETVKKSWDESLSHTGQSKDKG